MDCILLSRAALEHSWLLNLQLQTLNSELGASAISYNFDNFALAFQSLYEVSTFEKWSDYLLSCVDITEIGKSPWMTPLYSLGFCGIGFSVGITEIGNSLYT